MSIFSVETSMYGTILERPLNSGVGFLQKSFWLLNFNLQSKVISKIAKNRVFKLFQKILSLFLCLVLNESSYY